MGQFRNSIALSPSFIVCERSLPTVSSAIDYSYWLAHEPTSACWSSSTLEDQANSGMNRRSGAANPLPSRVPSTFVVEVLQTSLTNHTSSFLVTAVADSVPRDSLYLLVVPKGKFTFSRVSTLLAALDF
jgi:hypothetical protein